MLETLNQYAGLLNLLFAGVVAVSTVVYANLTWRLVSETKRMREVQTEPYIEVVALPREEWINWIYVRVRNIGLGAAHDVRFHVTYEGNSTGAKLLIKDFTKSQFFTTGLKYLGPGDSVPSGMSMMTNQFQEKIEAILVVTATYKNSNGESRSERHYLNFAEFEGRSQLGQPPLREIAKNVEKLQQNVDSVISGFMKIKVDTYDSQDRKAEAKERKEWMEHVIEESNEAPEHDGS